MVAPKNLSFPLNANYTAVKNAFFYVLASLILTILMITKHYVAKYITKNK